MGGKALRLIAEEEAGGLNNKTVVLTSTFRESYIVLRAHSFFLGGGLGTPPQSTALKNPT